VSSLAFAVRRQRMNCAEVRRMLDAYLDGELDLTRKLDVETHLPGCATCKDAAEEITKFCSLVRMGAPVYKGPPELKAKIQAALQKESKPRCGWFSQFSLPLAYAAAVLVLSFGLAWTWRTFSPGNDQELIAQADPKWDGADATTVGHGHLSVALSRSPLYGEPEAKPNQDCTA
jgi:anti-sigma factor RsiW